MRKGGGIDHICRIVSTSALSMPSFFTGLLLVFVFYYILGIAPAPLGRLPPMAFPPPERTGFMIIDAVLARDWTVFPRGRRRISSCRHSRWRSPPWDL